jgi:hypothetical protein
MTTGEVTDPIRTPTRSVDPVGQVVLVGSVGLADPADPVGPDGNTTELIAAGSA